MITNGHDFKLRNMFSQENDTIQYDVERLN